MSAPEYTIHRLSPSSSTAPLHRIWQTTIAQSDAAYALPAWKLHELLTDRAAVVFLALPPTSSSSAPNAPAQPTETAPSVPELAVSESDTVLGFAVIYTIRTGASWNPAAQHLKGSFSFLAVGPPHQGQGIGSALHSAALTHLEGLVRTSLSASTPPAEKGQIILGSVFPRIFPGVPAPSRLSRPGRKEPATSDGAAVTADAGEEPGLQHAKRWFERKGWKFSPGVSIDLYQAFEGGVPQGEEGKGVDLATLQKKAKSHGVVFREAKKEDEKGVMAIQDEFEFATGWPDLFPALFEKNLHSDVFVALDKDGKIIGATIAALPPSSSSSTSTSSTAPSSSTTPSTPSSEGHPVFSQLAWPATLGKRCASIACVGIHSSARSYGAGIGLVAAATESLAARGADGCFIDWVNMVGFYERAGYAKWERAYWEAAR